MRRLHYQVLFFKGRFASGTPGCLLGLKISVNTVVRKPGKICIALGCTFDEIMEIVEDEPNGTGK